MTNQPHLNPVPLAPSFWAWAGLQALQASPGLLLNGRLASKTHPHPHPLGVTDASGCAPFLPAMPQCFAAVLAAVVKTAFIPEAVALQLWAPLGLAAVLLLGPGLPCKLRLRGLCMGSWGGH